MFDLYKKVFGQMDDDIDELDDLDYLDEYSNEVEEMPVEQPVYQARSKAAARPRMKTPPRRQRPSSRVLDMQTGREYQAHYDQEVIVMVPYDFEMTKVVCDHVRNGRTVICNIEKIDDSTAQRVLDFILGAAYSLNGSLESISNKIFVVTPPSTKISVRTEESVEASSRRNAYRSRYARNQVFPHYGESNTSSYAPTAAAL